MVIGVGCVDRDLMAYAVIEDLLTHSAESIHFLEGFGVVFIIVLSELSRDPSVLQYLVED